MKFKILFVFFFLLVLIYAVSASEYSGDGTVELKVGDKIVVDNGWGIEVTSIIWTASGKWMAFKILDTAGNPIGSDSVIEYEGKKRIGSPDTLTMELEILNLSGRLPSQSPVSAPYEIAEIRIVSVSENLPGSVGSENLDSLEEAIDKVFTYEDGKDVAMNVGDNMTMGNGYILNFERIGGRWPSPTFALYDSKGSLIDNGLGIAKEVGANWGSYVYVKDFDGSENSVNLVVIEGSRINFGTGWNLFSIPLEDGDGYGTLLESTCNDAIVWSWNNSLGDYVNIGKLERGTKIPKNQGVWVKVQTKPNTNAEEDCSILVSGKKDVTTEGQELSAGWNLIAAPISSYGQREVYEDGSKFNLLEFSDIIGTCEIEKGPWQYTQSKIIQISQLDYSDTEKYAKPLNDNVRLTRGYFINVKEDCTLTDI